MAQADFKEKATSTGLGEAHSRRGVFRESAGPRARSWDGGSRLDWLSEPGVGRFSGSSGSWRSSCGRHPISSRGWWWRAHPFWWQSFCSDQRPFRIFLSRKRPSSRCWVARSFWKNGQDGGHYGFIGREFERLLVLPMVKRTECISWGWIQVWQPLLLQLAWTRLPRRR